MIGNFNENESERSKALFLSSNKILIDSNDVNNINIMISRIFWAKKTNKSPA